jgi:hypothetical protein
LGNHTCQTFFDNHHEHRIIVSDQTRLVRRHQRSPSVATVATLLNYLAIVVTLERRQHVALFEPKEFSLSGKTSCIR